VAVDSRRPEGEGTVVVELSHYVLDVLHKDEEFVLYRGEDSEQPSSRSVLLLSPAAMQPALETLRKIEHEYSLKDEVDSAWAVRPLGLSEQRGRTTLVLEDPGGETLDRFLPGPMEMTQFLRFAIGLAAALGELHKRELIHKDVKPTHVLVNPETFQVRLMGFGIASRLPRERPSPEPPEFIAGTLAYMAPEQTGRMNRSIDSRSDLYALGVTLYEMLIGTLPFTASDPMELVHCHIARQPTPPRVRLKSIPDPVSAIIMKLLAKTAEERYQTAAGAASDLRRCLDEWETQHRIDEFPLGEHDTPDRLLIPEKLYGRASEIKTLLAAFDRIVAGGRPELVLVSGYSGIGKSSVVNELHKPLVPPRGLFVSGKFDQYKRDIPYATLAQASQSLIRLLLSKSEKELSNWRDALHEALDPNGQLMVELVPELKLIIGEQPPVPELPRQDAQGRFQLVFRRFISVFTRERPLAVFLDDLQWLDAATLDLIEDLLTQPDVQHLMLIGAYRDNEVNPTHPLVRKLQAIRQAGAIAQDIVLAPLAREDLRQLVADSLHCEPEHAKPLAQLIHDKTAGNPFFAIQFFSALAEENLLTFDHGERTWSWDLNRIHAKGYADNVVDLMVGKLNRLPVETVNALKQLACLGNSAEFALLALVYEVSGEELHSDMQEALRTGLVVHSEGAYKFLHDRVQEAAYSLIPEHLRAEAHLRIGRLLAEHTPREKREEAIFEIVNQLNRGAALITSQDEREQLAELNLIAGKRAKASSAYASALKYLTAGAALLPDDCWERRPELILALELHRAECELLTAELATAEARLIMLSSRATNAVDQAAVACLRVDLYTTLDRSDRAVDVCLAYMRHLGVDWSPHPPEEQARREYERTWSLLGSRAIDELVDLPLMSDALSLATQDVLTKVVPAALFTDSNLLSLVICRMVNLSLEHGNSDGSCFAYVFLGMVAGPHFNNYEGGFQFGRLGYALVEKRSLHRYRARTYMAFGSFVMPWTRHIRTGRDLVRRAFDVANRTGDLTFGAYSCNNLNTNLLAAGDELAETQREAELGLEFAYKARFGLVVAIITAQLQLIRTLRGLTPTFGCFDEEQFDERRFEHDLASQADLALAECWYWIRKLQARVLAGDYRSAIDASSKARPLLWTSPSFFETAEYEFYSGLCRAALCDCTLPDERCNHFEALSAHFRQLEVWAANCPENFENRTALVGAEIARLEGRELDAEHLYEKAILSAHVNGFVHNAALANELGARFYAARGFEKIAKAYLREARYGYLRWGATGKVKQLDHLYPHLRDEAPAPGPTNTTVAPVELLAYPHVKKEPDPGPTSTIVAPVELLDLATVIKVSQAISGEMVLKKLIDRLMRAAIEHAGAERGLLIVPRADELQIEAEAMASGEDVTVHLRDGTPALAAFPESLVRYVMRTQETVILDDASVQTPFSADPYIVQCRAHSILCLPLINHGKLIGSLYLENNLTPYVFTPDRVTVLKVLASQAAISLENSRLYHDLEDREGKIRRLVDANILGIFIWNLEGAIVEANEAFLRMLQYDRNDLVSGRVRWTDLTPTEWREVDERALTKVQATGTVQPYEKEYFRKDGCRVPVLIGAALFQEGGNEGVAFVLDLSERKRSDEALRSSEAYLAEAQRLSHTGSFRWRPDSGEIVWSDENYRIFEYDRATTPTMDLIVQRVHPEDRADFQEVVNQASLRGTDFEHTYRLLMPDGRVKHFHARAHGTQDESGHVEFLGAGTDITDRKNAEEKVREHEAELRQMLDLTPQQVAVFGPNGERLYANRVALDYLGLSNEEEWLQTPGSSFRPGWFMHPDDRERFNDVFDRALSTGAAFEVELRVRKADGSYRWFLGRYNPLHDDKGQITRWYAASTDIEERKQAEERLRHENIALREEFSKASMFEEIVGDSPALQSVLSRISKVAPAVSTVLITGETGTGKELIARAIHRHSKRCSRPFVSVNCAAIPRDLIASELFGHEKGAFTGALQRRLGKFELAEGGTIFLDEVGELPAETQIALLRVLQEHEFERVGGNQAIRTDVRVISATNRDLQAAIAAGVFRSDLFYRLNVFPIDVPPLRERKDDITMLVEYFIHRYARQAGKKIKSIDKKTLELVQTYPWPGNIRELQNVIERSVILCETEIFSVDESWLSRASSESLEASPTLLKRPTLQEREIIEAALAEAKGRVSGPTGAAAKLGIPSTTLESKIKSLKINKHHFKAS
jgi:PAS domain S-box-containing protein